MTLLRRCCDDFTFFNFIFYRKVIRKKNRITNCAKLQKVFHKNIRKGNQITSSLLSVIYIIIFSIENEEMIVAVLLARLLKSNDFVTF